MMKVHQALNGFHIVKSKNGSFFTSRQCFNWLVLGEDITGHYWIIQVIRRQEKKQCIEKIFFFHTFCSARLLLTIPARCRMSIPRNWAPNDMIHASRQEKG